MPMTLAALQASLERLPDAELASRIGSGDAKALELVMRRHNRQLYRTARSILRDDADAEDCLQEAYLQAFRSIAGFRAESKLSTWLTRVVINQALEKMRKRRKEDGDLPLDNVLDLERQSPRGQLPGQGAGAAGRGCAAQRSAPGAREQDRWIARRLPHSLHAARARGDERRGDGGVPGHSGGHCAHSLLPCTCPAARSPRAARSTSRSKAPSHSTVRAATASSRMCSIA